MKSLKTLGLAAVAAMALTAFLGAGTASATVLCKTNLTAGCAGEWDYPVGTTIHATLEPETTLTLQASFVVDTCTESTVKGKTTNTGSEIETVDGPIEVLTFGNCVNTTHVINPGSLEVHHIAGTDNGTVTSHEAEVTVLTSGVSCIYGTANPTDIGTITGGSMATMDINATIAKISGSIFCPSSASWTGSYTVTSPEPLYVSAS